MAPGIRKVAVLGAGVMGSGIAAHLASCGIRAILLDIVPPNLSDAEKDVRAARNRWSQGGLDKALAAKPAKKPRAKNGPAAKSARNARAAKPPHPVLPAAKSASPAASRPIRLRSRVNGTGRSRVS